MIRCLRTPAAIAIAAAAVLGLSACNASSTTAPAPSTTPATSPAITVAADHLVAGGGLGDNLPKDPTELKALYCGQRKLGPVYTRIDLDAGWILTGPQNDFSDSDRLIKTAEACGLKPLVLITGSLPSWANVQAFGRALATRYPEVEYWEGIGNELNFKANNPHGQVNPARDAGITATFAQGIQQANPHAHVISPSVGPADNNGSDLTMGSYVKQFWDSLPDGAKVMIGVHVGCFPQYPGPDCDYWMDTFGRSGSPLSSQSVYQTALAYGTTIAITEMTGGTLPDAGQAKTLDTAAQLLSNPSYVNVGMLMWFGDQNWPNHHNGLGDPANRTLRAAYQTYAADHQTG